MTPVFNFALLAAAAVLSFLLPVSVQAQTPAADIGIVAMHGKGGSPDKHVNTLAQALRDEGYQVASLDMPWSARRQYDVDMNAAVNEITTALDAMRARGAKKLFVAGHSQGGLFTLYYGGRQIVDGLIAIAPGGNHGAPDFRNALGAPVGNAKAMIDAGRGGEKAVFADFEGAKGAYPITTTAAVYYDWFNPDGPHNMSTVVRQIKSGIPVLYVAPTRDYPALAKSRQANFAALPAHELSRLYEPESSHIEAPTAASREIIRWIGQVAARP